MICPNCNANVVDGAGFCANCGSRMPAAAPVGVGNGAHASFFNNSTWDGSVFDTFVNSLVASLIMTCTCFIATPWALCYMFRFIASHTVINGRRLRFDGDGASLFGNYLVWMILTTITCGIYGFWVTPKLYKWVASNIHFAD